jgi:hypothetical protein
VGRLFAVVSECCGGRIKATQARALVCEAVVVVRMLFIWVAMRVGGRFRVKE